MKKISLLIATLLVLVSSIIFCGCGDDYKKLKIKADTESIELVLNHDTPCACKGSAAELNENCLTHKIVNFEIDGVKSWGNISIDSSPSGMVDVLYTVDGKQCAAVVTALQPTGTGASLNITHLGSGKSLSIPLNVGLKLQDIESKEKEFVIQTPSFDLPGSDFVEIEIPTSDLLKCYPSNYTDNIVWQKTDNVLNGVEVVSYNSKGEVLNTTFTKDESQASETKITGTSYADKTVIRIRKGHAVNEIVMNPISVLKDKAVLYKNVNIKVSIVDLLEKQELKITSATHGNAKGELVDLVLVSNPETDLVSYPGMVRDVVINGFNSYSTAIIDLNKEIKNPNDEPGQPLTILDSLDDGKYQKLTEIYNVELSSDFDGLLLDSVSFGKIRVTATSKCYGSGNIYVNFVPKNCVGNIEGFEIKIPCTIGERATSFKASNNREDISINKINDYSFSSITALNDSDLLGQEFKFEVLSTNTLQGLTSYQIVINQYLLYIPDEIIKENKSQYILDSNGEQIGLTDLLGENCYEYQISILKNGKHIKFYKHGENFVSDVLTSKDTIYMKWEQRLDGKPLNIDFKIQIQNVYYVGDRDNEVYDIDKSGLEKTIITYDLAFNRQRTVESISYLPVFINTETGQEISVAEDAKEDWKFYFSTSMIDETDPDFNEYVFYGIKILGVLGLGKTELTPDELANINLKFVIEDINLGFALYENGKSPEFANNKEFDYDSNESIDSNIMLIGKIGTLDKDGDGNIDYGEYEFEIKQTNKTIKNGNRNLLLYKKLEKEDISVGIQGAKLDGSLLEYEYITEKPDNWDTVWENYYEYVGGRYVKLTNNTWDPLKKAYYQKKPIELKIDGQIETTDPAGAIKLDIRDFYILSTSTQYGVSIEIDNKDFSNIKSQTASARMLDLKESPLPSTYLTALLGKDKDGNNTITTSRTGSFNTVTGEKNFIQIKYTVNTYKYEYYKVNDMVNTSETKTIYLYVYEPLTFATFDKTMLYKYAQSSIPNESLQKEYSTERLNLSLNNEDGNVSNYVDIRWSYVGVGIESMTTSTSLQSAEFVFDSKIKNLSGRIIATITQFGIQYPVYCNYQVTHAILADQVVLETPVNTYRSGGGYLNFKVKESKQVQAKALTIDDFDADGNRLPVSLSEAGFEYVICNLNGYKLDGIVNCENGLIRALAPGRAKLIIISKDVIKTNISSVSNYFKTSTYLNSKNMNAYVVIDILVSDGSEDYPFLIANKEDFKNINNDFVGEVGDMHNYFNYALVGDIDLNGEKITIEHFEGSIISFDEGETQNRFKIYGIRLTENNPVLFKSLGNNVGGGGEQIEVLRNIDFYVDIDYIATSIKENVLIGLIGTNNGLIDDVAVFVSGIINGNNLADVDGKNNSFTIGAMVAVNNPTGNIKIDKIEIVGVQGNIVVNNTAKANVVLGGVVGENQGIVEGSVPTTKTTPTGDVEYETKSYYDNQGAIADIDLRVKEVKDTNASAMGGVIGLNSDGIVKNIYSMGKVVGTNDINQGKISNIGGLIGRNINRTHLITATVSTEPDGFLVKPKNISYSTYDDKDFQIFNSYSSAYVEGSNNVGGAVGDDQKGTYKKVYYEIYNEKTGVKGNDNVGGLIGRTLDSNMLYCYVNSFVLNYKTSVDYYEIIGINNVGGLIGLAQSSKTSFGAGEGAMNIVSSLASVSLTGTSKIGGLIGKLEQYGAIYTAYFYGVINPSIADLNQTPIAIMYNGVNPLSIKSYNNAYAIVNGEAKLGITTASPGFGVDINVYQGPNTVGSKLNGFGIDSSFNRGLPYILDEKDTNLVSVIPTAIQISNAFEYADTQIYKLNELGNYYKIDEDTYALITDPGYKGDRYSIFKHTSTRMFKQNKYGDYYKIDEDTYAEITDASYAGDRYSLMAELEVTGDVQSNASDYRERALILYYYPINNMLDDVALDDYHNFNTVDMKNILNDSGIIILPATLKRFSLRTSDSSIATVLSGGKLLLQGEGQVTITIVSTLNPNVSASFVVIVRTKVLKFGLYSNANIKEEYNVADKTLNIVKKSSKLLYADYSADITRYNNVYDYKPATNMKIKFKITYNGPTSINVDEYIELNGTKLGEGQYEISYGAPIMVSVLEYIKDGEFEITATPYVVANYKNESYRKEIEVALTSTFVRTFKVITKQGASALNTTQNQFNMTPTEQASNVDIKITTDILQTLMYIEIEPIMKGETSIANPLYPTTELINFVDMLDINYSDISAPEMIEDNKKFTLNISAAGVDIDNKLQEIKGLSIKVNSKAHYIDVPVSLQVHIYVMNGDSQIGTTLFIEIEPQAITSVVARNYRMDETYAGTDTLPNFNNVKQSDVIRPGSTNIITVDIVPNIAVYDYVEIKDLTAVDKIYFQQVDTDLNSMGSMDTWVDSGIKLSKYDIKTSKLYLFARLPLYSTANIVHTIEIVAYDKQGNAIYTTYLNLTAVMYPTIVMTYTYPNGQEIMADTRKGARQIGEANADLAVGVEAGINIETYNIDEGTLKGYITIDGVAELTETYKELVNLEYKYGTYFLYFNTKKQGDWEGLIGKDVEVHFTASKSLNGVTETCEAIIKFTIRRMVIHGISIDKTTINNELYGDWDIEFTRQFCFDKTDISYFNLGYWNVKYTLENTQYTGADEDIKDDMQTINGLLQTFNSWDADKVLIYFGNKNETKLSEMTNISSGYNHYDDKGIYIVNDKNKIAVKAKEPTAENKAININDMKLNVLFKTEYEEFGDNYPSLVESITATTSGLLSNEFGFRVSPKSTPFDDYIDISTAEEFETMLEGKYYKLTDNIVLTDYTPLNTAIGGFNGDGNTITIKSGYKNGQLKQGFNIAQIEQDYIAGDAYIGLFGTLAENSIIQNVKVLYGEGRELIEINLNNNEIIQQEHDNNIYFGGIAGVNLGMITNVLVEGSITIKADYIGADKIDMGGIAGSNGMLDATKQATITGSTSKLTMAAISLIGGVSGTNYGKITNSNFAGRINKPANVINQYVADVITAGFVVNNTNEGYISLSYVKCGLIANQSNIHSLGSTAGFVLNNEGEINNCFVNETALSSQGNIGGFAYQSTGKISNSYAYATLGSSIFYNEFIYNTTNVGTVEDSYVVTDSDKKINIIGLKKISTLNLSLQTEYKGFIFAKSNQGVWSISDSGPQLLNSGFNSDRSQYNNIYNIYDIETFDGFFTATADNIIENKTFRFVRDIDFSAIAENPSTASKILQSNLEGNDMALINYNVYKSGNVDSIGLFSSIKTEYVRNLILKPASIMASSGKAVGSLAGIIDGGNIYNIVVDCDSLLMLGRNAVGGLAGVIKGSFELMGISSNISAFATYYHNIGDQYNLYYGKNETGSILLDNLDKASYAGAVAGIIDGYNMQNVFTKTIDNYYSATDITVTGEVVLIGETVGGAFGMVGERTLIRNLNYDLPSATLYQGIYVSGGLVGENRGIIQSSSIYAYKYTDGVKERIDTTKCFDGFATVNGAIVGINIAGLVDNCLSEIDVRTTKSMATAGGIVGRNVRGFVYNCSVAGTLDALFSGGIVGTDYNYETIIKQQEGFGTPTYDTMRVYKSASKEFEYQPNCFVDQKTTCESSKPFVNNIIEYSLINDLVNRMKNYYTFNNKYDGENDKKLVDGKKLFGLVIGLTNKTYATNIEYYDKQLKITSLQINKAQSLDECVIGKTVDEVEIKVNTIKHIETNDFDCGDLGYLFIYMIAYENSSAYEFWSGTLGYHPNQLIVVSRTTPAT